MKVCFVRHGESEANALNVHQDSNGGLSERGIKQAEILASRLAKLPVDFVLSSSYERASHTANIINAVLQKEIEYSALLVERRHPSEIVGRNPSDPESMKIRKLIDENYGKDGWKFSDEETFYDLRKRALAALKYIAALNKNNVLVVTHGAFLRFLICTIIFGEDITPQIHRNFISHVHGSNTGLTVCEYSEGKWKLLTWNDLAHLE